MGKREIQKDGKSISAGNGLLVVRFQVAVITEQQPKASRQRGETHQFRGRRWEFF